MSVDRMPQNVFNRDWVYLFFREKWLAVGIVIGCLVGAVAMNLAIKKEYEAGSRLLIKVGHEKTLVALTSQEETYSSPMLRPEDIATEIEIFKSPDLLRQLVLQNGVKRYLPEGRLGRLVDAIGLKTLWMKLFPDKLKDPEEEIQDAVEAIEKKLKIDQIVNTDIMSVRYTSTSPQMAADTLNQLVDLYLEKHMEVHSPKGISELLGKQAEQTKQELAELQGRMTHYLSESSAGTGAASQVSTSPSISYLETKLVELELESKRLGGIYEKTSQPVQEIERQLGETRSMLRTERQKFAEAEKRMQVLGQEKTVVEQQNLLYEKKLDASRMAEALDQNKIYSVSIVNRAVPPTKPKGLVFPIRLLLALGIAVMLCVVVLGSIYYLDDTFHEEERITARLQLPVAGSVPLIATPAALPSSAVGGPERFQIELKKIVNDFMLRSESEPCRVLLFTSAIPREGVSSISRWFADLLAHQSGKKILLLDGNPLGQVRQNAIAAGGEAADLACGEIRSEGRLDCASLKLTGFLGYTAKAAKLQAVLQTLGRRYDLVVVDANPVLRAPDLTIWFSLAQAYYFVLQAGRTRIQVISRTLSILRKFTPPLLGVVLNQRRYPIPPAVYKLFYQ